MSGAMLSLKTAAWLRTLVRRMGPVATDAGSATGDSRTDMSGRTQSVLRAFFGGGGGRAGLRIDPGGWLKSERTSRARESTMPLSEERLTLALDGGVEGIWDCNLADRSIWISERWLARLGYAVDAIEARQPLDHIVHAEDRERLTLAMVAHARGLAPTYECEHRVVCRDGTSFWVLTRGRVVERNGAGKALRAVGTQIDISHRREAEARVEYLALHDDLTGLPNRRLLRQRLDRAVIRARNGRFTAAVLACDLDGFKAVNDTLGHSAGDRLLRIVADRLSGAVGSGNTVARLGSGRGGQACDRRALCAHRDRRHGGRDRCRYRRGDGAERGHHRRRPPPAGGHRALRGQDDRP
jgi:PAS domain S-box-containing protein